MPGAPSQVELQLSDELQELEWPCYLFMLELDGTLNFWQFHNTKWINRGITPRLKEIQQLAPPKATIEAPKPKPQNEESKK